MRKIKTSLSGVNTRRNDICEKLSLQMNCGSSEYVVPTSRKKTNVYSQQ